MTKSGIIERPQPCIQRIVLIPVSNIPDQLQVTVHILEILTPHFAVVPNADIQVEPDPYFPERELREELKQIVPVFRR